MKKKQVAFTIADKANEWMVPFLRNSLRKFHTEEELPLIHYNQGDMDRIKDPEKFYFATPYFMKGLTHEYDTVLKLDCDQIITGDLNHILYNAIYDVGTVYNWNRTDPIKYGIIEMATIPYNEYYNNGFVAVRNEDFAKEWWGQVRGRHWGRMPFREQGFLNILTHYGRFRTVCFDDYDPAFNYSCWHGLRSKGEWLKVVLNEKKELVLPRGNDDYPERDKIIKVLHWAGGKDEKKMHYRTSFQEPVIERLDWLVGEDGNK
jgi:hypothetical protein